jgi:hypothetical protein
MFGHLNHGKSPLEVTEVTGQHSDIVSFACAEAVTAGEWVDLDSTQAGEGRVTTVVQSNVSGLCVGVALETVTAAEVTAGGATVRVCVAGYVAAARTNGAVAATGDTLIPAGAGEVTKGAATDVLTAVGVALDVDAGGAGAEVAPVWIFRKL